MENISKSKYFLVFSFIIIIAILFYLFSLQKPTATPYKVVMPDSYDLGTTVSLYKTSPPAFPNEVILENRPLSYSGVVATREGNTQMKVSYQSTKSVADILALYQDRLPKLGWSVSAPSISTNVATFLASKGVDSILVTIAVVKQVGTAKDIGALVTFQYNK